MTALTAMLDEARPELAADLPVPKALLLPHAGYIYSGSTAALGYAALERGRDVDVLTTRQIAAVAAPIPATRLVHLDTDPEGVNFAETEDGPQPLPDFLAGYDIIVNCVLQDTDAPVMFLTDADLPLLSPGTLVVDVSCDETPTCRCSPPAPWSSTSRATRAWRSAGPAPPPSPNRSSPSATG